MHSLSLLILLISSFLFPSECRTIEDYQKEYKEGDRYFYFPDGKGKLKLVDLMEPPNERVLSTDVRSVVTFNLNTRNNPEEPQTLEFGDLDGLKNSHFTVGKMTVVLGHGWTSNPGDMKPVVDAFLDDGEVNVIRVDWSIVAQEEYTTAKAIVPDIGAFVGDFVSWLVSCGVSYDEVHIIGISLGAQMLASAGKRTNGRIGKITALDPAAPLWTNDAQRLQPTDAQFVEVLHTNIILLGYRYPCGDVDIYPDGGGIVTACQSDDSPDICSHVISQDFLVVSLRYPNHFVARQCSSFTEATTQICNGEPFVFGTSDLTKTGSGIYNMATAETYPY